MKNDTFFNYLCIYRYMDDDKLRQVLLECRIRQQRKKNRAEKIKQQAIAAKEALKKRKEKQRRLEEQQILKKERQEELQRLKRQRAPLQIYNNTRWLERWLDDDRLYTKEELMNPPKGEKGRLSDKFWELIDKANKNEKAKY